MASSIAPAKRRKFGVRILAGSAVTATGLVALAFSLFGPDRASATVGEAFMAVPGLVQDMSDPSHRNWLRIEAHYWMQAPRGMGAGGRGGSGGRGGAAAAQGGAAAQGAAAAPQSQLAAQLARGRGGRLNYSGPDAPAPSSGPQKLVIAVDKRSPGLAQMMASCASKAVTPDMTFAEASERSREPRQIGPRPAGIPEYFQYKLKDVQISDCPVVDGAPEQAFILSIKNIEWSNYSGTAAGMPTVVQPPVLTPIRLSGATKTFVVSWFADANDVSDDQCAKMNYKPAEEEYFTYMSKEDADKERAEMAAKKISVGYENEQMAQRGPLKINVAKLPGVIKASPHYTPTTKIAYGLDLDGNDGTGTPAPGTCKHKNYLSEDGRKGIDNQLYTAQGCSGMRGHKGFYWQYSNEQRRNGTDHIMVQVSGIDNERNDDLVYVTFFFSKDVMAKNADGSKILADYTYRLNTNPEFTYYTARLKGKIVNGAIVTERAKQFRMHTGLGVELQMYDAGVRLQIMPDGSLKGIVAGYQDWRRLMIVPSTSTVEQNFSLNIPTMYQALRQYADGMKDPVTGICYGVSSTWAIEGSAAFIPPTQTRTLVAEATPQVRQVRKSR